ncbi:hypothetical protein DPMN_014230 [Dreissena polymorpha]|uniref:Uncharacterized protein n=1 Tax=Dreissena polymorpha TaxID=45954 RepID=A0A9D4S4H2_DREPO|nr:hypothetical protein DPMN_014230 [Dreissena polymorpha]
MITSAPNEIYLSISDYCQPLFRSVSWEEPVLVVYGGDNENAPRSKNDGGQHDTGCGNDILLFNSTDLAVISHGPSRFANAGRPAKTGMIRRFFLTLKPVNSPEESRAPVVAGCAPVEPRMSPGEIRSVPAYSRLSPVVPRFSPGKSRQRPGRAPVYRNTAGTHRGYAAIRPRQGYGNAPVSPRSSPVMPRRNPGECRWHSNGFIGAPPWRCRRSAGVCMGSGGATVPSRLFPVPSRLFPVPRRSLPVLPGDSRFIQEVLNILKLSRWSPGFPRFIPVVPGGAPIPDHAPGLRRHHIDRAVITNHEREGDDDVNWVTAGFGCNMHTEGAPGLVMGPCIVEIDQVNWCRNEEIIRGAPGLVMEPCIFQYKFEVNRWLVLGPCIAEIDCIVIRKVQYHFEVNRCRKYSKTAILGGCGLCGRGAPGLVMGTCIVRYQFEDNRCRNEEIIIK